MSILCIRIDVELGSFESYNEDDSDDDADETEQGIIHSLCYVSVTNG